MRLGDIESTLSSVIEAYLKEIYSYLRDKPCPAVICLDDAQFKATLKVRDRKTIANAAYNIPTNTLYFRSRPIETSVAHELEHWAQAQRAGADVYLEQLQSEETFLEYEKSADEVALGNAFKLSGKY